eukprot:584657-Hanusia_phi.AAC.1
MTHENYGKHTCRSTMEAGEGMHNRWYEFDHTDITEYTSTDFCDKLENRRDHADSCNFIPVMIYT